MNMLSQTLTFPPESQPLPPLNTNHQSLLSSIQPPPPVSDNGFPMLAVAILGITAVAFLLISYYIFVTKCCFRWQQLDPLRRFRMRQNPLTNEDPLASFYNSPSSWQSRGLDEHLIRELPTFQYSKNEEEISSLSKCVVCLTEFQDHDMLRVLPKCSHAFHLDCIDVWLQNNSNCPLCRSTISGRNRYRPERILAPNSSPQDQLPSLVGSIVGGDEDFVVIELIEGDGNNTEQERGDSRRFLVQQPRSHSSRKFEQKILISKPRKFHHVSIMGDEGINVRATDDQFSCQTIRRSFSMDSAVDRHVYLSVQEILRQNRQQSEVVRSNGESSSSSRSWRPIFSFGQGRGGSKNSVLPVEF